MRPRQRGEPDRRDRGGHPSQSSARWNSRLLHDGQGDGARRADRKPRQRHHGRRCRERDLVERRLLRRCHRDRLDRRRSGHQLGRLHRLG